MNRGPPPNPRIPCPISVWIPRSCSSRWSVGASRKPAAALSQPTSVGFMGSSPPGEAVRLGKGEHLHVSHPVPVEEDDGRDRADGDDGPGDRTGHPYRERGDEEEQQEHAFSSGVWPTGHGCLLVLKEPGRQGREELAGTPRLGRLHQWWTQPT